MWFCREIFSGRHMRLFKKIPDLGFCIEVIERLNDADIGKLSKDDFCQTYAYAVLLRIAKIDNLMHQYVDKSLSLQRFDPTIKFLWALSILQGMVSGKALFTLDCLEHPSSLAIMEGRMRKMDLGLVELEILRSKEIKSNIVSPSMKELMSTKGVSLIDIDDFKSELAWMRGFLASHKPLFSKPG